MVVTMNLVLLLGGLVSFGLAAASVPARVSWVGLGLLLVYLRELV